MFAITRPQGPSGAAQSNVASANADTLLLAANPARMGGTISNESTSILYISLGASAASATNYWRALGPTATVATTTDLPTGYTGVVRGFWVTANGFARITEFVG